MFMYVNGKVSSFRRFIHVYETLFVQFLLFASSNDSEKVIPIFQEAAKSFKGKV